MDMDLAVMRLLSVENYPGTTLGRMNHVIDARDVQVNVVRPFQGEALPADSSGFDAMIIFGGAQDAADDENYPYFPELLELIRTASENGKHVLGVCLGAQLVARAFGGRNLIDHGLEFGFQTVFPTPEAASDPLLSGLGLPQAIFEWHRDSMTLPQGAVHLAHNEAANVQAFRIGETVHALQFHFEVNAKIVAEWTSNGKAFLDENAEDWQARLARGIAEDEPGALAFCDRLTARWIDLINAPVAA